MGFENVPDKLSGVILMWYFCTLCELAVTLMGSMASQYEDEPMEVEAEVRCCIVWIVVIVCL